MFNFLKKKSRVFLIFLALLLSFSSILNLSVPAFADDPPAGDTAGATTGDGTGTGSDGALATSSADSKQMEKKCKKIVGALGWIMCPLVFSTAKGVSNLYNYVENNFMQVRTSFFTAKLSEAWGKFRNVANIFFIVLFFIVIISQLTGVGIDNYGIKRIMPRLVVVAILINLSYIVCQLVTDVSNIVGYGAAQTISELGGNYEGVGSDSYIEIAINEEKSQYIRIVLTNGVVGVVGAGELLVVLLCLVIALLSTFIIWIFCLARDIGIIVMVMASPLAFACMLLPNTEGLYKKWFNLSKILWTLYPICGVTLGIGTFVSVFVYNNTGGTFLSGVAALLTATLPFVAIPYLLLNALSAFGTIGSKISNWGRGKLNSGWARTGRLATAPARTVKNAAGAGLKAGALASGVATAGIAKHTLAAIKSGGSGIANKRRQAALERQLENATTDEARQQIQTKMAQSQAKRDEALEARKEAGKEARSSLKGIATDTAGSAWATMRTGAAERNKARVAEAQRREETAKWAKGSTVSDIMERQAVARQNTEIKEEQARNATLDKGAVLEKLRVSAATLQSHPQGSAAYQTAESQTIAAIRDVYEKGGKDNLVDWARNNPTQLTPRLIQELSGVSPEFKEYAKNQALSEYITDENGQKVRNAQRATDFAEFYNSGKLSGALATNGPAAFASFDKDNWKVLADVAEKQAQSNPGQAPAVLADMPAGSLANAFVNATDGKTIDAQIKVTNSLTAQQRDAIIQEISPEQYTKLSNGIKIALAGANNLSGVDLTNKVREAFSAQIAEVESNDRLRSRISPTDIASTNNMQGPPRPPVDQTRINIPHDNPNDNSASGSTS